MATVEHLIVNVVGSEGEARLVQQTVPLIFSSSPISKLERGSSSKMSSK
jgi:hypothetical protein